MKYCIGGQPQTCQALLRQAGQNAVIFESDPLLYTDEPTGHLDAEISALVIHLLFTLHQEAGTTLMLVTPGPRSDLFHRH